MHFRTQGDMLTVEAFYDPATELPDWSKGVGNMSATYAYGTQGVEVEGYTAGVAVVPQLSITRSPITQPTGAAEASVSISPLL